MSKRNTKKRTKLAIGQHLNPIIRGAEDPWCRVVREKLKIYNGHFLDKPSVHVWKFTPTSTLLNQLEKSDGARAAKRSLCRYLMVKTTAAHFSLRQQKITLANRPSPGQPITTNPGSV